MRSAEAGTELDHYTLNELIARSNTASIFSGMDLRTGRQVAVKIPHPEVEGDLLFYNRFRREQDITEKLDHPGVAKAFPDAERSRVYIAMELAQGRSLRHILSEHGKLPAERAVKVAVGICDALEYIHAQGVVHRDLKPENIIVDDHDRIKLIDFGIASQAGARRLTFGKLSQVMGTPDYISPEQVKGKRGDRRSDIYALGVILYEMLTGKTPFHGKNAFVIMQSRLINDPIPPREADPTVTPEHEEIIYRALARDPKKRYASARNLADDLLHPEGVAVAHDREIAVWYQQRTPPTRVALFYGMLAAIPMVIFALLILVARHG